MSDQATARKGMDKEALVALPSRYRARMVNSLSGFKSANLVGTQDEAGGTACCMVSSVVHLGSDPALLGVVFRPPGAGSHNYHNLSRSGCFTLSHVGASFHEAAHQTSARFAEGVSEFEAVGLTPWWWSKGVLFEAPAVAEAAVRIGLSVTEDLPLPNGCRFVIGAIEWVDFDAAVQAEDGFLDLAASGTVCIGGLDAYYGASRIARLSYAKPDRPLESRADFFDGWDG